MTYIAHSNYHCAAKDPQGRYHTGSLAVLGDSYCLYHGGTLHGAREYNK